MYVQLNKSKYIIHSLFTRMSYTCIHVIIFEKNPPYMNKAPVKQTKYLKNQRNHSSLANMPVFNKAVYPSQNSNSKRPLVK